MFEAFKVGITIALTNTVSSALAAMQRDFAKTDASALRLKSTLNEIKVLGASGILFGAVGYAGLKLLEGAVKPAAEYAHQLNIMNMAGMKQAEIADAVGAAWKNTRTVMTTTATENLKSLLDLKNVLGNMDEAKALLPIVTKIQTVLGASGDPKLVSSAHDIAFSMAKALDVIGAVRNPAEMLKQAEEMSKVITAFQGRVTPQMFQSVFTYARQAKFDMSDEFKYEILPSMMLEFANKGGGGGSRGVGPMLAAMYRITNQGYINKKSLPELESLGLIQPGTALQTTTSGTTAGAMKDAALAAANPFRWVNEVLVPAIRKKYGEGVTDEFVRSKINEVMRGNQLAASMAVEFFTKQNNFLRDQKIIQGALPFNEAFKATTTSDYYTAQEALSAQWENLKTVFGKDMIPVIVAAIMGLAKAINYVAEVFRTHPRIADGIVGLTAAISGLALTTGGILILRASFLGLQLAFSTLGVIFAAAGPVALIVAGLGLFVWGIYEVYNHWSDMKGLLGLVWHGIIDWLDGLVNGILGIKNNGLPKSSVNYTDAAKVAGLGAGLNYDVSGVAGDNGNPFTLAAPPPSNRIVVQNPIFLDGRQIGNSVTEHIYQGMNTDPSAGSLFDGGMSLTPAAP
jgi:hypothetical protein